VIGQANPSSLGVDTRELLERFGIPLLSQTRIQKELEAQAKAAQSTSPPLVTPQTGPGGQAGTAPAPGAPPAPGGPPANLYYNPRERIVINLEQPLTVEPVDEIKDHPGAVAFFAADENIVYVRKGADEDLINDYVRGIAEQREEKVESGSGTV
jgi:hypothetical protein